jgi:hypothetical protein
MIDQPPKGEENIIEIQQIRKINGQSIKTPIPMTFRGTGISTAFHFILFWVTPRSKQLIFSS